MAAPERPSGADLLALVAQAYFYRFPAGSKGDLSDWERSTRPELGDFVVVQGASAPAAWTLGWLVEVEPGKTVFETTYTIKCIDDQTRRWANVHVRAIPVGDVFELGNTPEDVRRRWQPEPPRREQTYRPGLPGDGIVALTIQKDGA